MTDRRRPIGPRWPRLDARSLLIGGLTALVIAVPAGVVAQLRSGDDETSNWTLALFMVVLQETRIQPGQSFERSRAVSLQQRVRVTATSASVRAEPNLQADEIATVSRGTFVSVTEEDRNWLRVALPEGPTGWVERQAFE